MAGCEGGSDGPPKLLAPPINCGCPRAWLPLVEIAGAAACGGIEGPTPTEGREL